MAKKGRNRRDKRHNIPAIKFLGMVGRIGGYKDREFWKERQKAHTLSGSMTLTGCGLFDYLIN